MVALIEIDIRLIASIIDPVTVARRTGVATAVPNVLPDSVSIVWSDDILGTDPSAGVSIDMTPAGAERGAAEAASDGCGRHEERNGGDC